MKLRILYTFILTLLLAGISLRGLAQDFGEEGDGGDDGGGDNTEQPSPPPPDYTTPVAPPVDISTDPGTHNPPAVTNPQDGQVYTVANDDGTVSSWTFDSISGQWFEASYSYPPNSTDGGSSGSSGSGSSGGGSSGSGSTSTSYPSLTQNADGSTTINFANGTSITTNADGSYDVSSGQGTCDGCTTQEAESYVPENSTPPPMPPNPTQAEINAYIYAMQLYSAAMSAYHAPPNTPPPVDTLPKNPDTLAAKRDSTITYIVNHLNQSPQMAQLRDSSQGKHEVALSGYDSSGNYKVLARTFSIGDSLGAHIVAIDTTTGANHKNINMLVHLHEKGVDPLPDNGDLYNLLNARVYPGAKNTHLNYSVIVCGDTLVDLAVAVTDTTAALQFINQYRQDSAVVLDSTGRNPEWGNYKGVLDADSLSMKQEFENAIRILARNGVSPELQNTYAQVYMLARYNMGLKMFITVNGVFKEIWAEIIRDASGNLTDIKIHITQ